MSGLARPYPLEIFVLQRIKQWCVFRSILVCCFAVFVREYVIIQRRPAEDPENDPSTGAQDADGIELLALPA